MNTNTAFLSLDTYSLTSPYINTTKTNFVFRNVNLKNIMGEMWNKYEKFSIRCVAVRYTGSVANTGSQAYMIQNNLKGLDWINCYDEKYSSGQVFMPVISAKGSNAPYSLIPTNSYYAFNFRKGKPIIDLEFQITNLGTNGGTGTPTGITLMPEQNYLFQIQPAEDNQNEMGYIGLYTNVTSGTPINAYPSKVVSNSSRTYTYYNYDMTVPCREFWDKYDDFEIILAGYEQQGYTGTTEQLITPIVLSGFNWLNNNTQSGYIKTSNNAVVGIIKGNLSGSDHQANMNMSNSPVQFKKSGNTITFTLEFKNYDNSDLNGASIANRICYLQFFIKPIKKNFNSEKGTLSISSAGLTTTQSNLGITNADYTDITINNVDLRMACNSFWDKYDKFNIFLTEMYPYSTVNDNAERCLNLYCEGLQLNQQLKDTNPQQTSQTWMVGPLYLQSVAVASNYPVTFGNTHSTMFYKSTNNVNLRFYVKEIGDLTANVTSQALRGTLVFTIVPIL